MVFRGSDYAEHFHRLSLSSTNALQNFDILAPMWSGKQLVLLLDYDGTLTPIVSNPEEAIVSEAVRNLLRTLSVEDNVTVGVVTGRSLPKIKNFVQVEGICYAGSHGFEVECPDGQGVQKCSDLLPQLGKVRDLLSVAIQDIPGAAVEDNKFSVSAHYRNVTPERQHEVEEAVDKVLAEHGKAFKKGSGKMVYEIKPDVQWNKGEAVLWVLDSLQLSSEESHFVVYIGDDTTDEDAFSALLDHMESPSGAQRPRGLGIKVTDSSTSSTATMTLTDSDEVFKFLQMVLMQQHKMREEQDASAGNEGKDARPAPSPETGRVGSSEPDVQDMCCTIS